MEPLSQAQPETPPGRVARVIGFVYRSRRKFATGGAAALALLIGGHVVFGANGLRMYNDKRRQEALLRSQIDSLQKENARLADHNDRLQHDPHTIEGAIRARLRYTHPDEVVTQVDDQK